MKKKYGWQHRLKNKRAASANMKRISRNKQLCWLIQKWVEMPASF